MSGLAFVALSLCASQRGTAYCFVLLALFEPPQHLPECIVPSGCSVNDRLINEAAPSTVFWHSLLPLGACHPVDCSPWLWLQWEPALHIQQTQGLQGGPHPMTWELADKYPCLIESLAECVSGMF